MLSPTHFLFAVAIAYLLRLPRLPAGLGGIMVDLDILLQGDFPLMHRGLVHTPLFAAIAVVVLYLVVDKPNAFGFGAGMLAHLFTDLITPVGISLLFPLPYSFSLNLVTYNSVVGNLGIMAWSGLVILLYKSETFQDWVQRVFRINLKLSKKAGRTWHG